MNHLLIGVDIIEIERIHNLIERYKKRFLNKIFTLAEQEYCLKYAYPAIHFAGRFAAKEAIAKALGTGITATVDWTDIEILPNALGKPILHFSNKLLSIFPSLKGQISISHCKTYAVASALIEN